VLATARLSYALVRITAPAPARINYFFFGNTQKNRSQRYRASACSEIKNSKII
jgi:hypothetical protein